MGRWGSKVPNFLVKTTIQQKPVSFRTLSQNRGGGGWVEVQSLKQIHGILSEKLLIFSKKQNAPNSLKSKTNLTFIFHLVESQTCAVGGWGLMFGTKSQKKVFLGTLSQTSGPTHPLRTFGTPLSEK